MMSGSIVSVARRSARRALAATLLASTALAGIPTGSARGQDATWLASPTTSEISTGANWTGGAAPTGTATFGASSATNLQQTASTIVSGWTFVAGAPAYDVTNSGLLEFNGAGITVNGGSVFIGNQANIRFVGSSTAGSATILNQLTTVLTDTSTAGTAAITNNGGLSFLNASTAGNSTITNNSFVHFLNSSTAGSATITNNNFLYFNDSSSAGSSTIINNNYIHFRNTSTAGSAAIINGVGVSFFGASTAGSAAISNYGTLNFNDSSTAGSATVINGGTLNFNDSSTAGSTTVSNSGTVAFSHSSTAGAAAINNYNIVNFLDSSTAGSATITNSNTSFMSFYHSASAGSAIINNTNNSIINFYDSASAGSAVITNNGNNSWVRFNNSASAGSATIANNGFLYFWDFSTAGTAAISSSNTIVFRGSSTAGSARITNSGNLFFDDSSTAGGATITNSGTGSLLVRNSSSAGSATINNSNVTQFFGSSTADSATISNSGILNFWDVTTAGTATIANSGGMAFVGSSAAGSSAITNASGGNLFFRDFSTAGTATIINGGELFFENFSTAGAATIVSSRGIAFNGSSSAGNANITNGAQAMMGFNGSASAGSSTIINAGGLLFEGSSSTGNATITSTGYINMATTDTTGAATVTMQAGTFADLSGYGAVGNTTIEAGATFTPVNGTLIVNGNLTLARGSAYGAVAGALASITGTAMLGGATLGFSSPTWQSRTYTVLTAAGGVVGAFSLDGFYGGFATVLYGANDVTLTIGPYRTGTALQGWGTSNTRSVAAAIDRYLDTLGGNAPPGQAAFLSAYYRFALGERLNKMAGEPATGAQSTAFSTASTFLGIMLDPMAGARGATASAPGSSLIEMVDTGMTPAARVAAGWSVWTKAFGQTGRSASDAGTGAVATNTTVFGVAAGADRLVSPDTLVGFALAGGGTAFSLGSRGSGTGEYMQLGLYGSTRLGEAYLSAALAYGWNRFDIRRQAGIIGLQETYTSAPVAHTFGGRIEAGRRFGSRAFALTPYAAAEAIGYASGAYRDSWVVPATGFFALAYGARTTGTVRTELGLRIDGMRAVAATADLLTFGRIAYAFQANTARAADASFQQLANSGFTVFGARASTHTMLATLGTEIRLAAGTRATASLDGELGDRHRSIRANVGLSHSW
jgi:uncharacterized protein with beta-barrel porin domain